VNFQNFTKLVEGAKRAQTFAKAVTDTVVLYAVRYRYSPDLPRRGQTFISLSVKALKWIKCTGVNQAKSPAGFIFSQSTTRHLNLILLSILVQLYISGLESSNLRQILWSVCGPSHDLAAQVINDDT